MKKIFILITILFVSLLTLTACGNNMDMGWGSFSFHYAHVQMYGMDKAVHFKIEKWQNDSGGIELLTKEHGTILLGDGTYMMYDEEECPLCGHVTYK